MNQQNKHLTRKKERCCGSENSGGNTDKISLNKKNLITNKKKSKQRQDNSLGELAKNFINYIRNQQGHEINMNDVVKKLKIKKRRLYDITNVLEGIGYIRKLASNKIMWVNDDWDEKDDNDENSKDDNEMLSQIEELQKEEMMIKGMINNMKNEFDKQTDDFKEYNYVTFDDIKTLTNGEDVNLLIIKASPETSLDIPDPEQIHNIYLQTLENMESGKEKYDKSLLNSLDKKYQLLLDSPNGEIIVYVVLSKTENENKSEIDNQLNFS